MTESQRPILNLDALHQKQSDAFQSPATEILYGGAAGGGKSHLMRVALILWCSQIAGLQTYLFRRTHPDLWRNHMLGPAGFPSLLAPWTKAGICTINETRGFIRFNFNGSQINLSHCQHEKNIQDYHGAEIHVLAIDELGQWPEDMYTYLRGRVRCPGLEIPEEYRGRFPRIICSANPGGIGHNWIKSTWWIDERQEFKIYRATKKDGGMLRQFVRSLLEDCPTTTANDPGYEDRLEGLGSQSLVRALRRGDWGIIEGGAFDDIWTPGVHIIQPFRIPETWYIDRSYDWGDSAPFSVGWWAESDGCSVTMADGSTRTFPKGTLFRIAEWYGWSGKPNKGLKLSTPEFCKGVKGIDATIMAAYGVKVRPGPADASIFDRTGDNYCIADNHEANGVRWTPADKSPGTRKQGLKVLRDRLSASIKTQDGEHVLRWPMENPGMFVFNTCEQFCRTVPTIPRDKTNPEDVDTKAEDHIYDETRYRCFTKRHSVGTAAAPW